MVPDYLAKFCPGDNVVPVVANAENLPFEAEFDLITSTDVVEHVLNISALLYSLNKALKPGGRLAIRVPYREDLLKYAPQTGYPYDLVHLRTFDRSSLRDLLAEAGFRVSQSYFDGFNFQYPARHVMSVFNAFGILSGKQKRKLWKRLYSMLPPESIPWRFRRAVYRPIEIIMVARKVATVPLPSP
ncbi:hypothetical protein AUC69_12365 [Methyloceanibacter superfactus]|uniref:Methyltransferase type 11 domain-containing protein n=1 Tax=Methyloceanibacter superfactus TaxID=1774969 RepID=A0A1E3VV64_9HYPH|nr:hypothetical protein AUC69_12365 [Methyloceanibacter superfactus]